MAVIIGSARIDENGRISGGKPGDQTGKEVSMQNFYMHEKGWIGLRAIDETTRVLLSLAMQEACDNPNIGYNQAKNTSFLPYLRKAGSFRKITTPCEADCGRLVRGCCIQAGFDPGDFSTATEASVLMNTKRFIKFDVKSERDVITGDILVTKTKGHTVIVVQANNTSNAIAPEIKPSKTNNVLLVGARSKDSSISGTYSVTASTLNVRRGPAVTYESLGTVANSTKVQCYGYYTETDGVKWYFVQTPIGNGYVSSKYLKKV